MSIAVVSLDAMDASGSHSLDVLHNVFKRRLDKSGNPVGESERGSTGTVRNAAQLLAEKQRAIAEGRPSEPAQQTGAAGCGPCYGAADEGVCCNTCEQVRDAYRRKGWQFNMKGVEQCNREGFYGDISSQLENGEGCNVYGHLEVPKVPGTFHFAPGHGMQHAYSHVHDLVSFTYSSFNVSHAVNFLSFGPYYPGAASPLNGHTRSYAGGSGMHQYFVKLVPTVYQSLDGNVIKGYQYSVTEHPRVLDPKAAQMDAATGLLPGVFFNYELSPLRVRIEEKRRSLGHFLTNVCAIIGGVFTVMGLVDALLYRTLEGISQSKGRKSASLGGLMQ